VRWRFTLGAPKITIPPDKPLREIPDSQLWAAIRREVSRELRQLLKLADKRDQSWPAVVVISCCSSYFPAARADSIRLDKSRRAGTGTFNLIRPLGFCRSRCPQTSRTSRFRSPCIKDGSLLGSRTVLSSAKWKQYESAWLQSRKVKCTIKRRSRYVRVYRSTHLRMRRAAAPSWGGG